MGIPLRLAALLCEPGASLPDEAFLFCTDKEKVTSYLTALGTTISYEHWNKNAPIDFLWIHLMHHLGWGHMSKVAM